jgi:NAD(P)-dependent dehydrogenase (short-subunit alcohol dehydrogenase family)
MDAKYPFAMDRNEFRKRVLVTGGTKGIGEAIVRRLTFGRRFSSDPRAFTSAQRSAASAASSRTQVRFEIGRRSSAPLRSCLGVRLQISGIVAAWNLPKNNSPL